MAHTTCQGALITWVKRVPIPGIQFNGDSTGLLGQQGKEKALGSFKLHLKHKPLPFLPIVLFHNWLYDSIQLLDSLEIWGNITTAAIQEYPNLNLIVWYKASNLLFISFSYHKTPIKTQ